MRSASEIEDVAPLEPWRPSRPMLAIGIVLAAIVAVAVTADLVGDSAAGADFAHVALEGLVVVCVLGVAVVLGRLLRGELLRARTTMAAMQRDTALARADAARWRERARDLVRGLAEAIDEQLRAWGLTDAEREVALLLLKGLSLKEIAAARGTSERTVRQQSLAVYRKAGLGGRAELSAFFLEDLLVGP